MTDLWAAVAASVITAVLGFSARPLIVRLQRVYKSEQGQFEWWVHLEVTPVRLIGPSDLRAATQLTIDGVAVADPQVVTAYFWGTGTDDVEATQFASNRPFALHLGSPVVHVLGGGAQHNLDGVDLSIVRTGELVIRPSLVRSNAVWISRLLLDGPVRYQNSGVPANVRLHVLDVERDVRPLRWRLKSYGSTVGAAAVVACLTLMISTQTAPLPVVVAAATALVALAVSRTIPQESALAARALRSLRTTARRPDLLPPFQVVHVSSASYVNHADVGPAGG